MPASDLPEVDSVVTFQFKVADLHVFDTRTEQNVSLPVPKAARTMLAGSPHQNTGVQGAALH